MTRYHPRLGNRAKLKKQTRVSIKQREYLARRQQNREFVTITLAFSGHQKKQINLYPRGQNEESNIKFRAQMNSRRNLQVCLDLFRNKNS